MINAKPGNNRAREIQARKIASAIVGVLLCIACHAQAQEPKLTFEVAAIRPSAPDARSALRGGPGTPDPVQIAWTACPLDFLVERAYGIQFDQFSGPGWLSSVRYDISAKVPTGATPEQFDEMLRNLLIERFHLEVHHETRIVPAYELVLGKNPPKLKHSEWVPPPPPTDLPPGQPWFGDVPIFRTGRDGNEVITGRGAKTSDLVGSLRVALHRRVEDRTGLTDKFDFTLEYSDATRGTSPYIIDSVRTNWGWT